MRQTLTKLDIRRFLSVYWQKQPLLIKQAYLAFQNPLPASKLMAIATEDTAEARIILEKGGRRPWELRHGPFSKSDFKKLPARHWTLLVQGTNIWINELATLLEDFYFIPQWRIEDVMSSYAVKGGNVGAHVDNYDVFLLQAEGQREWRISSKPILEDDFLPEHEVKLLRKFKADKTFVLNPGDMLYLPPRFAHHGIALTDNCITHSIGFRAPSVQEMLDDYLTHLLSSIDSQARYADPDLKLQTSSGEISSHALNKAIQHIQTSIYDEQTIKSWFGHFVSQNKYTSLIPKPKQLTSNELNKRLQAGEKLCKNPAARFAYYISKNKVYFYANGEEYILPMSMLEHVKLLTGKTEHWQTKLPGLVKGKGFLKLLYQLVGAGHFYF